MMARLRVGGATARHTLLRAFVSYAPLHQNFRDLYCTIECPPIIIRHTGLALKSPTALRCRVRPHEPIRTLPKDADISTVDV